MRVRFQVSTEEGWRYRGQILKVKGAPSGYTPNTVITEWLTLNCVGAWACRGRPRWIDVAFANRDDALRAGSHYRAAGLWR